MTRRYLTPPDTRLYAIGDIHGYRKPLADMIALIAEDVRGRHICNVEVIFLGDYVDRGPDSAGLLDDLIALKAQTVLPFRFTFLKGNHENGMLSFANEPLGKRRDWLRWGGVQTLESYGITPRADIPLDDQAAGLAKQLRRALPAAHRAFMEELALYHIAGGYLFVHAGIRPNFPMGEQEPRDLWMIREGFLDYTGEHDWRVVHGHTITEKPEILPNRINVDTGLYQHGVLSCAVLEEDTVSVLQVRR